MNQMDNRSNLVLWKLVSTMQVSRNEIGGKNRWVVVEALMRSERGPSLWKMTVDGNRRAAPEHASSAMESWQRTMLLPSQKPAVCSSGWGN